MSYASHVAEIILQQLGGADSLRAMIGAGPFLCGLVDRVQPALSFRFRARAAKRANMARIILDPSDTYTVELWRAGQDSASLLVTREGIYSDQLISVLEYETGLRLRNSTPAHPS